MGKPHETFSPSSPPYQTSSRGVPQNQHNDRPPPPEYYPPDRRHEPAMTVPLPIQEDPELLDSNRSDLSKTPYPQWIILLTRAILAIIEVGFLAFGCFFFVKWQATREFRTGKYELAVATVGVAMALDLAAVIFSTCRARFATWGYWMFGILLDLSLGVMGIVGGWNVYFRKEVAVAGAEMVEGGHGWEGMGKIVGLFAFVCGALHILVAIAAFIGCCITHARRSRSKQPGDKNRNDENDLGVFSIFYICGAAT